MLKGSFNNIRFSDFVSLATGFGFNEVCSEGSHHIFIHPELNELINIQDVNNEAKPYQIRQFLRLVERYNLQLEE